MRLVKPMQITLLEYYSELLSIPFASCTWSGTRERDLQGPPINVETCPFQTSVKQDEEIMMQAKQTSYIMITSFIRIILFALEDERYYESATQVRSASSGGPFVSPALA